MGLANFNPLEYLNVIADVFKALFLQWNLVEDVAIRFIDFAEKLSLNILHKDFNN